MEMWIGDLLVDASPPEKPKFKAPLLLIHGLWSAAGCWQRWATHFSNLGWECWAINFRGRFEEKRHQILKQLDFPRCAEDIKRVIRSSPFPPVVMAHNFGGLVAQKAAEEEKISALVLVSTLPPRQVQMATPRPLRLLRLKYSPLIFFRRPFRLEERDFRRTWLASVSQEEQSDILRRMIPESGYLIREFFDRHAVFHPDRVHCPVLVVGGGEDPVAPVGSLGELAQSLGGDLKVYPGHGHWMLDEGGGEAIAGDIHRWMVQKLGDKIFLAEFAGEG